MNNLLLSFVPHAMFGILGAIFLAFAAFLWFYFYRSFKVSSNLGKIIFEIENLKKKVDHPSLINPSEINQFIDDETTRHLWAEYNDTLHVVKNNNGTQETRATLPAEVYFTEETLVDSPLYADFYKHLPGIITGCAIICTFLGLIKGLSGFSTSLDNLKIAVDITTKVTDLIKEVADAFKFSSVAIALAMIMTFLEKIRIRQCHKKVEELCLSIDSIYRMGAGEEYMARLVDASESSDANTRQLKDSLVNDLKVMMENLTERQINSQIAQANILGDKIGSSIKDTFEPALGGIGKIFEKNSGDQSAAVQGLLQDVLAAFMVKLDDTFGSQIKGINETLTGSVRSMMLVQTSLEKLITDISNAGESATGQMAKQIEDSIAKTTESQKVMSNEIKEVFHEMKKMMADQQEKSKAALDENMSTIFNKMSDSLKMIEDYKEKASKNDDIRITKLNNDTSALYSGFSSEISGLIEVIQRSTLVAEKNISSLTEITTLSISELNKGSQNINDATKRLLNGAEALQTSIEQTTVLQKQVGSSADSLKVTSEATLSAYKEYDKIRITLDQYIIGLKAVVESSQKEFSTKKDIAGEIDSVIKGFKVVENETKEYLGNINTVLQNAFTEFSTRLAMQLEESFKETNKHVSVSISALSAVAQELVMVVKKIENKK